MELIVIDRARDEASAGVIRHPAAIDPRQPCSHPPGSEGKLLWLEARAALRLPLFHPEDARDPEDANGRLRVHEGCPRSLSRGRQLAGILAAH